MSYESEKIKYGREHIDIIEIDLHTCSLSQSIAPCTAAAPATTADTSCFNTLQTCLDVANFDDNEAVTTLKTFSFCTPRSPHPRGLAGVIPSIMGINITPSKIDTKGGLGTRASMTVTFKDHPYSDIDYDQNLIHRTYDPFSRSTFWPKLRARSPNYQFKAIRRLSGYLVDGEFIAANFQTQHFVINKLDVSNGIATITAKDPLTLAMSKKAQAPLPSTGLLSGNITAGALSATLIPAGVGNLEYETSGFLLIKSEIMSFTRAADVLTIVRGLKGTTAIAHSANDTVQQCLEYSGATRGQLDFMVDDLLTNFANIDSAFIPTTSWDAEVSTYLSGLLDGIIPKPMDVFKILKELSEAMPFYLSWDEREQEIPLTALKAPPPNADVLDMDGNLVADSVRITDKPEMRISTVFYNFDMQNQAKKLSDPDNWGQTYVRVDQDSIIKFGSSEVQEISSRWITGTNKAAALQGAALIGRRFANIPRQINFSLDAKDSNIWLGQIKSVNYRDIVDGTGLEVDTMFQITSAGESENFNYQGLEFNYGEALPEDEGGGDPNVDLIVISVSDQNINLRTIYNGLFPAPDASTEAKFVVENGVIIGGATLAVESMDTGSWPVGAEVTLQTNAGAFVVGRGGDGQNASDTPAAEAGSLGILLNHDLTLINNGVIGGGGGGGGQNDATAGPVSGQADGGGGAGNDVGARGGGLSVSGELSSIITEASSGTLELGGNGAVIEAFNGENDIDTTAGDGGDLGAAGAAGGGTGGAAGDAIDRNGFTLTQTVSGDIRGSILV